jgi:RNA polymerase sigma-70 factor (ECF subfamily)
MNQYQENEQREFQDENITAPLDEMMNAEISEQVSTALQVLSKVQRQTLALAFYRGMSHQQISTYTGQPLGTVKSNIRRAQDILRNVLDKTDLSTTGMTEGTTGGLYGEA